MAAKVSDSFLVFREHFYVEIYVTLRLNP